MSSIETLESLGGKESGGEKDEVGDLKGVDGGEVGCCCLRLFLTSVKSEEKGEIDSEEGGSSGEASGSSSLELKVE